MTKKNRNIISFILNFLTMYKNNVTTYYDSILMEDAITFIKKLKEENIDDKLFTACKNSSE